MSDLRAKLEEDRVMRDAAKGLVTRGAANLKAEASPKTVATKFAVRMREGAEGVVEDGSHFAQENSAKLGGGIALGLGLITAWFFRKQIADIVEDNWHHIEALIEDRAEDEQIASPQLEDAAPPTVSNTID